VATAAASTKNATRSAVATLTSDVQVPVDVPAEREGRYLALRDADRYLGLHCPLAPATDPFQALPKEPAAAPFVMSFVSHPEYEPETPTPNALTLIEIDRQLPEVSDLGAQSSQY